MNIYGRCLRWRNTHILPYTYLTSASDVSICIKKGCRVQGLTASLRNCENVYPSLFTNQVQNFWMIPGTTAFYRYVKLINSLPIDCSAKPL